MEHRGGGTTDSTRSRLDSVRRRFFADPNLFFRYALVGAASALLELALFSLFYSVLAWPLLAANSLAIALTLVFHFSLTKYWTFRDPQSLRRQLPRYLALNATTALLNTGLIYLFVAVLEFPPQPSKVVQIGLVFGFGFVLSRAFVFTQRR